jgi:hypothetical protein
MNMTAALDVATLHRSAADGVIGGCDDRELGDLILSLLALFDYAARQMMTELGWFATVSQLCQFSAQDEWPTAAASGMIIAHQMMGQDVDGELWAHGASALQEYVNTANATNKITDVIFAIVDVWRIMLPALEDDLLKHFVGVMCGDG